MYVILVTNIVRILTIFLAVELYGIIALTNEYAKDYLSKVANGNCTVMFPSVSVQFIGFKRTNILQNQQNLLKYYDAIIGVNKHST